MMEVWQEESSITIKRRDNMFKIYDSMGNYLRSFPAYQQAMTYKIMCQRYDWTIREIRR